MKPNPNNISEVKKKEFLEKYLILIEEEPNSKQFNQIEWSKKVRKIFRCFINGRETIYLIGKKYWYRDYFIISRKVFVPQYDTEGLLEFFNKKNEKGLEIGIGTGVLSISLSKYFNKEMYGIDVNRKAIQISKKNSIRLNQEIILRRKNLLKYSPKEKFDFIISNPPYISIKEKEIDNWVLKNQPKKSLYANDNGLFFYKYIINNRNKFLKPNGRIYFEIGYDQKEPLEEYLLKINVKYNFIKDFNNIWRFLEIKTNDK